MRRCYNGHCNRGVPILGAGGAKITAPSVFLNSTAMEFDGINQYVDFGDKNQFSFGNAVTDDPVSMFAWVNMDSHVNFSIFNKLASSNFEYQFWSNSSGLLEMSFYDNNSIKYIRLTSDASMVAYVGSWVQIGFTYDGSSNQSGLTFYANGAVLAATAAANGGYVAVHPLGASLKLGGQTRNGYYANGTMKDAFIASKELSISEIGESISDSKPADLNEVSWVSDIVEWWRLGDGDGDDYSTAKGIINSDDGVMTNMSSSNYVAYP